MEEDLDDDDSSSGDEGKQDAVAQISKVKKLFQTSLSYSQRDINSLIDGNNNNNNGSKSLRLLNENPIIQELKTALKTTYEEINKLQSNCIALESRYQIALNGVTQEIQNSVHVLFCLQETKLDLQQSKKNELKFKDDIQYVSYLNSMFLYLC